MNPSYSAEEEYQILINKLNSIGKAHDILRKKYNCHPYTYGYNGENLRHYDQVLTAKEDVGSFQTLDYLFEINLIDDKNQNYEEIENAECSINDNLIDNSDSKTHFKLKTSSNDFNGRIEWRESESKKLKESVSDMRKLEIDHESSQVEYFLVNGKPYQQLSDHFGLSVRLNYTECNEY